MKVALILAGGKGTRLWPLSRENHPKQFVEFKDGMSLFQLSLKRALACFDHRSIFVITSEHYRFTLINQIEFMPGLTAAQRTSLKEQLIYEPMARSTLPSILLAMKFIEEKRALGPDDLLYVYPSDHMISPLSAFMRCMSAAATLAAKEKIVVFGVKPTSPKDGYGYVLAKKRLAPGFLVDRFVEKPDAAKAKALIRSGAYWNAGIFCFSRKVFYEDLAEFRPKIAAFAAMKYAQMAKAFSRIPVDSIDYGILQNSRRVALVEFNLEWSDLGSWDSFLDFHCKSEGCNFNIGNAEFMDANNCFVYSRNRLVSVLGVDNLIAIDAPDALLLVKKGSSNKVKDMVAHIAHKGWGHTKDGTTVYRPWGYYTILHEGPGYKVKEIGIYPKKSVALQKHRHRSEHWNVVEGSVQVTVDGKNSRAAKNESIYVARGKKHRIHNPTQKTAKIIEVQIGNYLGEDDIIRYDSY